jgi:SAM-dependent methyltransferase
VKRSKHFAARFIGYARAAARDYLYAGNHRFCPVCDRGASVFLPYGQARRPDVRCPFCGSAERHRFVWLFLKHRTDVVSKLPAMSSENFKNPTNPPRKRLLHLAAEDCLEAKLREIPGIDYLTADLLSPNAMLNLDITAAPFADETFDAVLACHVLQHIQDDRKALCEIRRILQPAGWAILTMPTGSDDRTIELPAGDPIGEPTHGHNCDRAMRNYGRDFIDRANAAGLTVEIHRADELAPPEDLARMRILPNESLYFCTKLAPAGASPTIKL